MESFPAEVLGLGVLSGWQDGMCWVSFPAEVLGLGVLSSRAGLHVLGEFLCRSARLRRAQCLGRISCFERVSLQKCPVYECLVAAGLHVW